MYVAIVPELDVSETCRDDGKNRKQHRAAPIAEPFLDHRRAAEPKPDRLIDKSDVDRRTNAIGTNRTGRSEM